MSYSLDLIKLRDVYERVYRRRNFSFKIGDKEYTRFVINVTTHYSVKEFNRLRNNVYVKNGWRYDEVAPLLQDGIAVVAGEMVAV